jgi:hypothetical protein
VRALPGDELVLLRGGSPFSLEVQVTANTVEAGVQLLSSVTASVTEV